MALRRVLFFTGSGKRPGSGGARAHFGGIMEQATFLACIVLVGYISFKWGFAEGIIQTSEVIADEEDKSAE